MNTKIYIMNVYIYMCMNAGRSPALYTTESAGAHVGWPRGLSLLRKCQNALSGELPERGWQEHGENVV